MRPRFRIVPDTDQAPSVDRNRESASRNASAPEMISVPLGQILEPLTEAIRTNRTFLRDFSNDEIRMSADLFDALTTFQRMQASA